MEISNNNHFANDAYLLSQQKYKAEQDLVTPAESANKDQQSKQNNSDDIKALSQSKESAENAEQASNVIEISPVVAINVAKAHNASQSSKQNTDSSYKVTAHNEQLARQAEKAVASYNSIENSQYGQELVNRIELIV